MLLPLLLLLQQQWQHSILYIIHIKYPNPSEHIRKKISVHWIFLQPQQSKNQKDQYICNNNVILNSITSFLLKGWIETTRTANLFIADNAL